MMSDYLHVVCAKEANQHIGGLRWLFQPIWNNIICSCIEHLQEIPQG